MRVKYIYHMNKKRCYICNRDGEEWLYYRRILNKVMLAPDSIKLMYTPCQVAAESLTASWRIQSSRTIVIENLERQLYQWSIEGKS